MSEAYQSLSRSRFNCKYHVVFVLKRRRKALFGKIRKELGAIFHKLARQKECRIIEGHLMADHVHMCISLSKSNVSRVTAFEAALLIKPPALPRVSDSAYCSA